MKLYRLEVPPPEEAGDGEDHDQWFASLKAAKRARQALIGEDPACEGLRYSTAYAIDRVWVLDLPRQRLVLAVLNRRGYVGRIEQVMAPYHPPPVTWICVECGEHHAADTGYGCMYCEDGELRKEIG